MVPVNRDTIAMTNSENQKFRWNSAVTEGVIYFDELLPPMWALLHLLLVSSNISEANQTCFNFTINMLIWGCRFNGRRLRS